MRESDDVRWVTVGQRARRAGAGISRRLDRGHAPSGCSAASTASLAATSVLPLTTAARTSLRLADHQGELAQATRPKRNHVPMLERGRRWSSWRCRRPTNGYWGFLWCVIRLGDRCFTKRRGRARPSCKLRHASLSWNVLGSHLQAHSPTLAPSQHRRLGGSRGPCTRWRPRSVPRLGPGRW
jgi:hypothetical protein